MTPVSFAIHNIFPPNFLSLGSRVPRLSFSFWVGGGKRTWLISTVWAYSEITQFCVYHIQTKVCGQMLSQFQDHTEFNLVGNQCINNLHAHTGRLHEVNYIRPLARDEWTYPLYVWDRSGSVVMIKFTQNGIY